MRSGSLSKKGELIMAKKIVTTIVWEVEDVLNEYPELTEHQAEKILDRMESYTCGYTEHGYELMSLCVDEITS